MPLAPQIEEAAVAEREIVGSVDAKVAGGAVDPGGRALQFGVVADGSFVDNAMALAISPLGAPFFIAERSGEAEGKKDVGQGVAIGDRGFRLDAVFVAAFTRRTGRQAFVGQRPSARVIADAQNLSARAQPAVGRVIEDVALKAARCLHAKAGGLKALGEARRVGNAEFDFGFDRHRQG